eukprot:8322432-Heterocapsa_arctica.AAC.2
MALLRLPAFSSGGLPFVLCEPVLGGVTLVLILLLLLLLIAVLGREPLPVRLPLLLTLPPGRARWVRVGLPMGFCPGVL